MFILIISNIIISFINNFIFSISEARIVDWRFEALFFFNESAKVVDIISIKIFFYFLLCILLLNIHVEGRHNILIRWKMLIFQNCLDLIIWGELSHLLLSIVMGVHDVPCLFDIEGSSFHDWQLNILLSSLFHLNWALNVRLGYVVCWWHLNYIVWPHCLIWQVSWTLHLVYVL